MDRIAANLAAIERRIAAACDRAGRAASEVRLLPVSKTWGPDAVRAVRAAGYVRFGENKVQEARAKAAELAGEGVEWAVIGPLQRNKAKYLPAFAAEFQALDSLDVAAELDRRFAAAGRRLEVLVQVNSSGEPTKSGLAPDEVLGFCRRLAPFDALDVRGLMTLAAHTSDLTVVAACFDTMARLRDDLRDAFGGGWDELSMGMSGDFELAIEHGATCVRIGTAIFGARLSPSAAS